VYHGAVKIKFGPFPLVFEGTARVVRADLADRRAGPRRGPEGQGRQPRSSRRETPIYSPCAHLLRDAL